MGCDIHMFVEYKQKNVDNSNWRSWGGELSPDRNYVLFGLLAKGVRSSHIESAYIKGRPEGLSYKVKEADRFFISQTPDLGAREVSLDTAQKYAQHGGNIIYERCNPMWVTDSDHHSHTWLTINEYEYALTSFVNKERYPFNIDEYQAVLAAMKSLYHRNNDVRLVIWFDN